MVCVFHPFFRIRLIYNFTQKTLHHPQNVLHKPTTEIRGRTRGGHKRTRVMSPGRRLDRDWDVDRRDLQGGGFLRCKRKRNRGQRCLAFLHGLLYTEFVFSAMKYKVTSIVFILAAMKYKILYTDANKFYINLSEVYTSLYLALFILYQPY